MDGFIAWLHPFLEAIGLNNFFEPNKRVYYPYLLIAFVLASAYFLFIQDKKSPKTLPKLFKFIFPKKIWLHQSAWIDYQLFLVNNLLKFFLIAPYFIAHLAFAYMVVQVWDQIGGVQDTLQWSQASINISYTIVFMIISDFSRFYLHYLLHKIPILWQFHKVHHSAEVLTPITLYRVHPIEFILFRVRSVLVFGLVAGTYFYWFRTGIEEVQILQIHIALFLFNMLGANLRHSHIPISFGKTLEHLFISPAQHQIHHGSHSRFFDKNFGSIFAIWDWIFGSLSISKNETIAFGIEEEEQKKFNTFWGNIITPFKNLLKR